MKKMWVAVAVIALLTAAPATRLAVADETATPAKSIRWIEGWAAGREAAKKSGKLMFVYVHRVNPG